MMSKSFIRQFLVKYQTRFNWQTLEDKSKLKLPYCFGKKWSTLKPPYGHNGKTMITLNLPRFHTVVRRTCNLFCKCTYAQLLICFNAIQKLQSSQCWNNPSLNSYEFYSSLMVRRLRFYEKGLMCGIHKKRNLPKKHAKITDMIKLMIYSEDDPRVHNAFVHRFIVWVLLISDQIRKKMPGFLPPF